MNLLQVIMQDVVDDLQRGNRDPIPLPSNSDEGILKCQ